MTNTIPQNPTAPAAIASINAAADPAFICWQSTGFTSDGAALACDLAYLQVQVSTFATQLQHDKERAPELAALKLQTMKQQLELLDVRLETIDKKMEVLQRMASALGSHLQSASSHQEFVATAFARLAADLELLGITEIDLRNLVGWVLLMESTRLSLHNQRLQAEQGRAQLRAELEMFNLHGAFVQLLSVGAERLHQDLTQLCSSGQATEYVQRGIDHLGQHMAAPLTKNWSWMLDERGEADDL